VSTATIPAILLLPIAFLWALPLLSDLLAIAVVAVKGRRAQSTQPDTGAARQKILVLVPAHNEASHIESCLRSLLAMHAVLSDYTVVVLADNCTDDTAAVARGAGVPVLERTDRVRTGKPRAIEWALHELPIETYDAVLIVDADTQADPGLTDGIAGVGNLRSSVVQAYDSLSNEGDSWLSLLAGLLTRVRYEGQFLLKTAAGLNCPLTGDGTCIGVDVLSRTGWAPDALTEGWELYARYTARGERTTYAPAAKLFAHEARTLQESATQRRRWQAGRFNVLSEYWRELLFSRRCGMRQKLDAFAELSSPGPVVHTVVGGVCAGMLALPPSAVAHLTAAIFAFSIAPLALRAGRAWARSPDKAALAQAMLRLPLYAVWRLGLSLKLLMASETRWQRSPR
jgi:cellulose synthase/poly-beta-1,6-N-acetylglucosamine synthase-like glycosyltransferase